ncbi:TPA: hypothetical protein DDW35_03090 [Candidatus Sumerlaeota bacterium]|jgi:outer membrane protein OmpA-like peptidoglycan-associated protein|nr:hypothetical protein [Candidatus Sumerlaeota bacterium]
MKRISGWLLMMVTATLFVLPVGISMAADDGLEHIAQVRFETGVSTLTQQATSILDKFAAQLKNTKFGNDKVVIEGYADARGEGSKNKDLGLARAESVKAYLVKKGLSADLFLTKSYGEYQELMPVATYRGLHYNRHVTFVRTSGGVESVTLSSTRMTLPGEPEYGY